MNASAEQDTRGETAPAGQAHAPTQGAHREAGTGTEAGAQSSTETVRVLLVDDHAIWRSGLSSLLQRTEFAVVGEASSGHEALEVARAVRPDLTLLDVRMAGGGGPETLQALKQEHPQMAVLMLTTYENPTYLARALAGGAAGYLLKGIGREELLRAMRAVARGEVLLTPEALGCSRRGLGGDASEPIAPAASAENEPDLDEPLTVREQQVLRLLARGLSNREIAAVLAIAEATARTHVEHIMEKLGVSDRVQAAVWAARHGLAETGPTPPADTD